MFERNLSKRVENEISQINYYQNNIKTCSIRNDSISTDHTPSSKTSDGKPIKKYEDTSNFLSKIESRNSNYYTDKRTIDKIGQIEAKGNIHAVIASILPLIVNSRF